VQSFLGAAIVSAQLSAPIAQNSQKKKVAMSQILAPLYTSSAQKSTCPGLLMLVNGAWIDSRIHGPPFPGAMISSLSSF